MPATYQKTCLICPHCAAHTDACVEKSAEASEYLQEQAARRSQFIDATVYDGIRQT